jgi:hypothetical protein
MAKLAFIFMSALAWNMCSLHAQQTATLMSTVAAADSKSPCGLNPSDGSVKIADAWLSDVKGEVQLAAEQMAERLLGAMEGEDQLPPIIAVAFQKRPKARMGWAKMTQTQRRQKLILVFYYQSIEAQQRRVEKLCENAEKRD